MGSKEKRDGPINPILFKFGVALAFSLGGIVYTFFRSKRIRPCKPKPLLPSPGKGSEVDPIGEGCLLWDEDCALQDFSLPKMSPRNSITDVESPTECDIEIRSLQSKVEILEERERILETQLLEYYGLKEQETAVMELQNRLRLHNMEAKLYNLKIESLQLDKRKLEAQVADYAKVVTELEAAKDKIKLLRKKLRSEAEQNREQILSLHERVMKLQDHENKAFENDHDVEVKLQKGKELEELEEMKKSNQSLKLENSKLARELENLQTLATSALDDEEIYALKEENQLLRQQMEDSRKEIEQLQADRCTDIEELVYLRWINACLRYEMRNYQPSPGETIARDLSKTLSPESEKKAKELILEYAGKEGSDHKEINISDFDSGRWSGSYLTESGEPDDSCIDNLSANRTSHSSKTKVFAKLMKLWRGKDSVDDIVSRYSSNTQSCTSLGIDAGTDGLTKTTRTSSGGSSALSVDLSRTNGESSNCSRRTSDDGSLRIFSRIDSITGYDDNLFSAGIQPHQDAQNAAKTELAKYAKALKNSRVKSSFRRRSASFGSF